VKVRTVLKGLIFTTAAASTAVVILVRRFVHETLYRESIKKNDLNDERATSVRIQDENQNVLNGYMIDKGGKTTIIMLHPLKRDASSIESYVPYFEGLLPDANILLVEALAHGTSDGYLRGLGLNDAHSLILWNKYLLNTYGDDHRIIVYGKGAGAVTALNASEQLKNVDAIISDGAYRDLLSYLGDVCRDTYGIPARISKPLIRFQIKNETGMDIIDGDTTEAVKHNTIPTIFIHSKKDKDVAFNHVFKIYNKNAGECALFPIKEDHVYDMDQEEAYSKTLETFLRNYKTRTE